MWLMGALSFIVGVILGMALGSLPGSGLAGAGKTLTGPATIGFGVFVGSFGWAMGRLVYWLRTRRNAGLKSRVQELPRWVSYLFAFLAGIVYPLLFMLLAWIALLVPVKPLASIIGTFLLLGGAVVYPAVAMLCGLALVPNGTKEDHASSMSTPPLNR